jgi:hypothetical protein
VSEYVPFGAALFFASCCCVVSFFRRTCYVCDREEMLLRK